MTEDIQARALLNDRIEAKFTTLGGQLNPTLRDKIDKLLMTELEGLVTEIEMAKTIFNAQLMIGAAHRQSIQDEQSRVNPTPPSPPMT